MTEGIISDKSGLQNINDNFHSLSWTILDEKEHIEGNRHIPVNCLYLNENLLKKHNPNRIFGFVHKLLEPEQYFVFKIVTSENIKEKLSAHMPSFLLTLYYPFHFILRRVFPKLKGFRKICRILNLPVDISKSEILGRLIYKGFDIVSVRETDNETCITAKINTKNNPSLSKPESDEGILFKMIRMGKNAEKIVVYKFRSMHPYAEYVQEYIHKNYGLDIGGKFKNDFRVSTGGRIIRKYWIDEIPMIYNLIRGDIKLIGVRPISEHYFNLYPVHLQELRVKTKPGLLPPFYADMPKSFQEIVDSELKYLKAYEKNPLKTDFTYLMKILINIFIKKARSK